MCSVAVCPVRSRDGAIALYIIDFDDPAWKEADDEEKNINTTCKSSSSGLLDCRVSERSWVRFPLSRTVLRDVF